MKHLHMQWRILIHLTAKRCYNPVYMLFPSPVLTQHHISLSLTVLHKTMVELHLRTVICIFKICLCFQKEQNLVCVLYLCFAPKYLTQISNNTQISHKFSVLSTITENKNLIDINTATVSTNQMWHTAIILILWTITESLWKQ